MTRQGGAGRTTGRARTTRGPAALARRAARHRGARRPAFLVTIAIAVLISVVGPGRVPGSFEGRPATSMLAHLTMLHEVVGAENLPHQFWTLAYEMVFCPVVTMVFVFGRAPVQRRDRGRAGRGGGGARGDRPDEGVAGAGAGRGVVERAGLALGYPGVLPVASWLCCRVVELPFQKLGQRVTKRLARTG